MPADAVIMAFGFPSARYAVARIRRRKLGSRGQIKLMWKTATAIRPPIAKYLPAAMRCVALDLVVTAMAEGRHADQGSWTSLEVKSIPLH